MKKLTVIEGRRFTGMIIDDPWAPTPEDMLGATIDDYRDAQFVRADVLYPEPPVAMPGPRRNNPHRNRPVNGHPKHPRKAK